MSARVLMLQGSMSSVGKSLLVAGLCRLYARQGLHVAPFKAQNMSNNAAVCMDGSEIGRAQYTQALACGIEPQAVMNPILLKPEADARSQVIVMGKPYASLPAREYYQHKKKLWKIICNAIDSLKDSYDLLIIEGAGSPVELNLKAGDLVNMAVAKYTQASVLLVGDIDRGGIFAQLLGTLMLLEEEERHLVKGLLVNKFRGDPDLFMDGIKDIEKRSSLPVLGLIPYIKHNIPEEDAVAIETQNIGQQSTDYIDIAVVRFPRIANFDDFDALNNEEGISVRYIDSPEEINEAKAIILPGTKSTMADLSWLQEQGLDKAIQGFANDCGAIVGICGGYQMLGKVISDPNHIESGLDEIQGLELLDIETTFDDQKATHQVSGSIQPISDWLSSIESKQIKGYEIHMGKTNLLNGKQWLKIHKRGGKGVNDVDGAVSEDGRVWGCYLHGIFDSCEFRHAWLGSLGWQKGPQGPPSTLDSSFDHLADVLQGSTDLNKLNAILGI